MMVRCAFGAVARRVGVATLIAGCAGCSGLLGVDEWLVDGDAPTTATAGTGAAGGSGASTGGGGTAGSGGGTAGSGGEAPPTVAWTRVIGGPGDDVAHDVACSDGGLVAVVGDGYADIAFEPGGSLLAGETGKAGWAVVYNADGTLKESHTLHGANDQAFDGSTFAGEAIVLSGWTVGPPMYDQTSPVGYSAGVDGIVISGGLGWHAFIGDGANQWANGLAATSAGNIVVGGRFEGVIDNCPATTAVALDGFVLELGASGGCAQQTVFQGGGDSATNNVAVSPLGRVLIGGTFTGSITVAGQTMDALDQDSYAGELTADVQVWGLQVGGAGDQELYAVANEGGVTVSAGRYETELSISEQSYVFGGVRDGFVIKHGPLGDPAWVWTLSGAGHDEVRDVAVLDDGRVLFGGSCTGCGELGLSAGPGRDGFVAMLSPAGVLSWAVAISGPGDELVSAVGVDADGRYVAGGEFGGTANVLGRPLSGPAGVNSFLVVLQP